MILKHSFTQHRYKLSGLIVSALLRSYYQAFLSRIIQRYFTYCMQQSPS